MRDLDPAGVEMLLLLAAEAGAGSRFSIFVTQEGRRTHRSEEWSWSLSCFLSCRHARRCFRLLEAKICCSLAIRIVDFGKESLHECTECKLGRSAAFPRRGAGGFALGGREGA